MNLRNYVNFKKIPKSVLAIIIFFMAIGIQLFVIKILNYDIKNMTDNQSFIVSSISDIIIMISLIIIYFKDLKEDLKKLKSKLYETIDIGFRYWMIGLIIMVVSNIIISLFISTATAVNENQVQEMIKSNGIITIFIIGIVGPIIEELVFRKAFKDVFTNKYLFIIISGLVFGGLHVILSLSSLWDLVFLIPYCSLGISFAAMSAKTDNMYTSIFMHMFHNTVFTAFSIVGLGVILW